MRFAAIDIGSNAMRLLIAESGAPSLPPNVVVSERVACRLASGVFRDGVIPSETMDTAINALAQFRQVMDAHNVKRELVVATASVRAAKNEADFIKRAASEAGLDIKTINGLEEARLVARAVSAAAPESESELLFDLGGGSLEVVHRCRAALAPSFSASLEVGTVRLLEAFTSKDGVLSPQQAGLVREHIARALAPLMPRIRDAKADHVLTAGGNFVAIAKLCGGKKAEELATVLGARPMRIGRGRATSLLAKMQHMPIAERMETYELREDRADVILPALFVTEAILDACETQSLLVPDVGLKEGMILELHAKEFSSFDYEAHDAALLASVDALGTRYEFDRPHAHRVERFASTLFDALADLLELRAKDKVLLQGAALLHDIGCFVSVRAHHKHAEYLIKHAAILGLSRKRQNMLAAVARYHRRGHPSKSHPLYAALPAEDQQRVSKLAAILRIADGLDRGHIGRVQSLDIQADADAVHLSIQGDAPALEAWAASRKASLLESLLDRAVRIDVVE